MSWTWEKVEAKCRQRLNYSFCRHFASWGNIFTFKVHCIFVKLDVSAVVRLPSSEFDSQNKQKKYRFTLSIKAVYSCFILKSYFLLLLRGPPWPQDRVTLTLIFNPEKFASMYFNSFSLNAKEKKTSDLAEVGLVSFKNITFFTWLFELLQKYHWKWLKYM